MIRVNEILVSRRTSTTHPFDLSRDQAYRRVKYVLNKAGISNASPHTLRKTAGAYFYMKNRDIFATSKWLGHSTVTITERYYAGLIQSLQREYSEQYEERICAFLDLKELPATPSRSYIPGVS